MRLLILLLLALMTASAGAESGDSSGNEFSMTCEFADSSQNLSALKTKDFRRRATLVDQDGEEWVGILREEAYISYEEVSLYSYFFYPAHQLPADWDGSSSMDLSLVKDQIGGGGSGRGNGRGVDAAMEMDIIVDHRKGRVSSRVNASGQKAPRALADIEIIGDCRDLE